MKRRGDDPQLNAEERKLRRMLESRDEPTSPAMDRAVLRAAREHCRGHGLSRHPWIPRRAAWHWTTALVTLTLVCATAAWLLGDQTERSGPEIAATPTPVGPTVSLEELDRRIDAAAQRVENLRTPGPEAAADAIRDVHELLQRARRLRQKLDPAV